MTQDKYAIAQINPSGTLSWNIAVTTNVYNFNLEVCNFIRCIECVSHVAICIWCNVSKITNLALYEFLLR